MSVSTGSIEQLSINTIRTLSMDAVQKARSGHPGTAMALAPVTYVLFNEVLLYDPAAPAWPGRDRFVLSCGHASMLLYSMLHLTGVKQLDGSGHPTASHHDEQASVQRQSRLHWIVSSDQAAPRFSGRAAHHSCDIIKGIRGNARGAGGCRRGWYAHLEASDTLG